MPWHCPCSPGFARSLHRGHLDSSEFGIAKAFKQGGYATFFAGKWHLASKGVYPEDQGFDYNYGGGLAGAPKSYFYPYNESKKGYKGNSNEKPIINLDDAEQGEYLTDHLTRKTLSFIKENKDTPFFVFLSHYGVHTPFEGKQELKKVFNEKLKTCPVPQQNALTRIGDTGQTKMYQDNIIYAAMIQSVDKSFGKLMELLESLELSDSTIIVFTSDHGGLSNRGNERKLATSNLPLRAGKGHNYEGGIRVPMFIKFPKVTKNSVSNEVVTGSDLYPTLLEMVGLPLQKEQHLDGKSFYTILKGEDSSNKNRPIFWHSPLSRPKSTGDRANTTVRKGDYKLLDFYEEGIIELYNIKDDIGETNNLAKNQPTKRDELLNLVKNWRKEINAYIK